MNTKHTKGPIALPKDAALDLAIKALKEWGKYGQEMRVIGRGADCSWDAVGYHTDYLVSVLELSKERGE